MKRPYLLLAGALALTAAIAYAQMEGYSVSQLDKNPTGQSLIEVVDNLQKLYLYPIDKDKVLQGAIAGAIGSLNDEFTYYSPPETNQIDAQNLAGEFYGIGVTLGAANADGTGGKIENVFKNGAAFNSGVQIGDMFVKVGDKEVINSKLDEIVRLVRGEKGTLVMVTFARNGKPYTVKMERQPVKIVSVEQTVLPNGVGYIALSTFYNEKAGEQFRAAVMDMKKKGIKKLVLDLRDNGGGLLTAGVDVADQFLPSGNIVSLRERSGKSTVYGRAKRSVNDYTDDLVVLVNKNSASASEIVSAALQDAGRAKVVGEQTFGKGVAQIPVTLANGGKVAIVNSAWLSPKGREIHKKGVNPDVVIKDSRFPTPLNFAGSGLPAGASLTVTVAGKPVMVTADKDGKFTYVQDQKSRPRSSVQGEALVDPASDAILRKGLEVLGADDGMFKK